MARKKTNPPILETAPPYLVIGAISVPPTLPASEPGPPRPAKRRLTYFVVHGGIGGFPVLGEDYEVFDSTNGGLRAALERLKEDKGSQSLLIVGKILPVEVEVKTIVKVRRRKGKP